MPQLDGVELLVQFGLSHQQDLEQLFARRLEVGQETDLLEHFCRNMVRFVDHQHGGEFLLMARNHVVAQHQQKLALVLARHVEPEVAGNILQELDGREPAIEYVGVGNIALIQQLQQAADEQRFAGTDFSGHDHESLVTSDAVVQRRQRFVVSPGGKKKKRIRSDLEGITLQIVEGFVH